MVYICTICGYVYDEDKEGAPFAALSSCPRCGVGPELYKPDSAILPPQEGEVETTAPEAGSLEYARELARFDELERHMADIHEMAVKGGSIIDAMGTRMPVPGWDEVLLLGAQLCPVPLAEDAPVNTKTVIGKNAKRPLELDTPVFVSHMSFGALSREVKISLAKGSAQAGAAMCSGEGGILPDERAAACKYIFEVVPNLYSVTDENLQAADAIEIKIGQGTKPGMGGHLPGEKVTEEIAAIRGRQVGRDIISPSQFPGVSDREGLKKLVNELRRRSGGRPVGVKLAAGHIERDLACVVYAGADFVTLDGRGGATGASPKLLRDATGVPTIYALRRARRYLDKVGSGMQLVITGGLRVSADFAKALALGADAVAVATAALMAAACQQYKICKSGGCPVGVATQDPELRKRLNVDASARRVYHFLHVATEELRIYGRITGKDDVHALDLDDVCTTSIDLATHAGIPHAAAPADF